MTAALAGGLFALGLLVILRGLFPQRASLKSRLAAFNDGEDMLADVVDTTLFDELALTLFETIKGDDIDEVYPDLRVTDTTVQKFAAEKARAAVAAGVFAATIGVIFGVAKGVAPALILGLVGAIAGYYIPDFELKKKAEQRRIEFSRALTAYITLLGSSISGGGGVVTAMSDAAAMGSGWVFVKLRNALDEANLAGTSPWIALDELGRKLYVPALIELSGSLTLAGGSGARITETLHARAESAREKELTDVRSEAEAKSSSLGLPVGLIMLAFAVFIAYPAVLSLMGSA